MKKAASLFLAAQTALSAAAMTPPTMSAQVAAGSSMRGLGAATGEGLRSFLTVHQSARHARRRGTSGAANPDDESDSSLRAALLLNHRIGRNLSLLLSVPHVRTQVRYLDATRARVTQTTAGLGDIGVFGRWSFHRDRLVNPSREWLGILGVELGTGSTKKKDGRGNTLAATQQPGSGTTDLVFGAAVLWAFPTFSLHGDASYKLNGERAYAFGDVLAVNGGATLPLVPRRLGLVAELNGEFSGRDRSGLAGAPGRAPDGTVLNTGGETVYAAPALQWSPAEGMVFTAGAQWALYQNLRGTQLKAGVGYSLGVSARFP